MTEKYSVAAEYEQYNVAAIHARLGVEMPAPGREAHRPSPFRIHVSVFLAAEEVAA